jgi:hypothetical protein
MNPLIVVCPLATARHIRHMKKKMAIFFITFDLPDENINVNGRLRPGIDQLET